MAMWELDEKKYLWLLLAVPVLVLLFLYSLYWKKRRQREFGDPALFRKLAPERSDFKSALKTGVLVLALACIAIGLVNPKIGMKTETVKRQGIDIVFAVDVSKSMLCEDVAPSRLKKARQIVSQIINNLAADRIGIVAYAGSAYQVLPITTDYGVAKMYLESLDYTMVSSQGTSLQDAVQKANDIFKDTDKDVSKLVIMVSDGEDHGEDSEEAIEDATKNGVKIITVGVGTEAGGRIPLRENGGIRFQEDRQGETVITKRNTESLREIAKATKGGYVDGNNTREVVEYVKKALDNIEKSDFEAQQFTDFASQFQWFLGFGVFLLCLDILLLEKKTAWIRRLNLFNDKG